MWQGQSVAHPNRCQLLSCGIQFTTVLSVAHLLHEEVLKMFMFITERLRI